MPNVAQITIAGHVGKDAELKYTQDGTAICEFSVAVNYKRDDSTAWYRVTVWRKYGEIMKDIVKKGMVVTVIGDFQPRQYTDKEGAERWSFDVTATHVIVAGQGNSEREGNRKRDAEPSDIPF